MKKIQTKKIILLLLFAFILPLLNVSAYTPKDLSRYAKEINEAQNWKLEGQVELTKQQISTVYNGAMEGTPLWNNHTVQWLTVGEESAVKPVVWSVGGAENWKATNLDRTIQDYETTHPGYIVVGAVNGDFFDNSAGGTGEPTNFHVQEGDVLRAKAPGGSYRGVLGFGETNKDHVAVFGQQRESNMSLEVLQNGKTVETLTVAGTNKTPSESGVNVYTKKLGENVNLSGYVVYEGTYTKYRDYSGGYFLKGTITGKADVTSLSSVEAGKFYVAAKSEVLTAGANVKVEYNLAGELAGIENAVGFIYQVLKDGQPQYANTTSANNDNALFINTTHPRTLVGFKEDGSIVLMVIDGRGSVGDNLEGASLFQCGELLRLAGCVEGYNLDGGGSSTLMARINGEMTLINDPSDARQTGQPWGVLRSTGNAVLLVMKDPKLQVQEPVGNSITLKKTGEVVDGTLQNVTLNVDGKEYEMTGNEVTVTGLIPNMEYSVSYSYEILNKDGTIDKGTSHTYTLKTEDYAFPELKDFEESKLEEGVVTFKYRVKDDNAVVSKMYVKNGDVETLVEGLSGKVSVNVADTTVENEFVLMAELTNGKVVELAKLVYAAGSIPKAENTPVDPGTSDNPTDPGTNDSGCKKDLALVVTGLITMASLGLIVLKKKR
ncbi:MAG: phosphodiester glycosidase family protein [Bacilli bacterium]|nr:phosphodiester glycosidase family protein [Bacilli bacterium]